MAKDGFLGLHTVNYSIDVQCQYYDYSVVLDLASSVSLLMQRWGNDYFSKVPDIALKFAEELDKLGTQ